MPMYCPSDTRTIVNRNAISNFAVRYHHFLENEQEGGRVKFSIDAMTLGDSQGTIVHLRDRQTNQLNYLVKGYHYFCEFYEVDWRMIIGLGGEHVQETNMMFDHIYGIPYLPGSAFKGVVRSWVIQEDFGNDEKLAMQDIQPGDSTDLEEKKKNFLDVFGGPGSAGKVQFLPAYPIDNVTLSLDIMNPHFSDYYTGTSLPTDTQNPKPIKFLTVEQTPFRFVLLSKEQHLAKIAEGWVHKTLRGKGLGAKTAVGYGYFRRRFDVPKNLRPNANFQVPLRTRLQRAQQISLEEANEQLGDPHQVNPFIVIYPSQESKHVFTPVWRRIVSGAVCVLSVRHLSPTSTDAGETPDTPGERGRRPAKQSEGCIRPRNRHKERFLPNHH